MDKRHQSVDYTETSYLDPAMNSTHDDLHEQHHTAETALLQAREPTHATPPQKLSPLLIRLLMVITLSGLLFGFDTGVISGAMLLLREEFQLTDVQQEWIVGSATAGAMVGALLGGPVNDRFGRRPVVMFGALLFVIGSVMLGLAQQFTGLLIGRIILGIAIGFSSMTVPMYIAEVSPPERRGAMVSFNQLSITAGQFVAYLIAAAFASVPEGWRYMLGLGAVPALVQIIGMIFLPESPRFLIKWNRIDEAKSVLSKIGVVDVDAEVETITSGSLQHSGSWKDLFSKRIRPALILGAGLQAFQQLVGINTAMYYSATILKMAGFPSNQSAIFFSTFVAFTNMMFTFIGLMLIDRSGRRKLVLVTLIGCVAGLVMLGVSFYLVMGFTTEQESCNLYEYCSACVIRMECGYCGDDIQVGCLDGNSTGPSFGTCSAWSYESGCEGSEVGGWMALVSLVLYVAFFAMGMGPVPWTVMSEIFPLSVRGKASGVATASNWTANLIVSVTLLTMFNSLSQAGTFFLYAGFASMAWVFIFFFLPETKGRSLEQITEMLVSGKF